MQSLGEFRPVNSKVGKNKVANYDIRSKRFSSNQVKQKFPDQIHL